MNKKIWLLDLSNIAYRSLYGTKLKTKAGNPSGHVYGFVNTMKRINTLEYELVFALDEKPERKLRINPQYKANRHKKDFNPVPDVRRMARLLNGTSIWCKGEEADDVIASFVENNRNREITIVSSDADLFQLINRQNKTRQFNPGSSQFIDSEDLFKKYRLTKFDRVALWKALFGDSGDNVKPPLARLRKNDLIEAIERCNGTPGGFMRELELSGIAEKTFTKIKTATPFFEAGLRMNYGLVSLKRDVDYMQKKHNGNLLWLCELLRRFECNSLINEDLRRIT